MTLKEIRKYKGLTQSECAIYLGISLRSYKSYENDYKDFREAIDVRTAIECFKNPYLW